MKSLLSAFLAVPVLLAVSGSPDPVVDPTTGAPYRPAAAAPGIGLGGVPPLVQRPDVLWVETNGVLLNYSAFGNFAAAVADIGAYANITIHTSGPITPALLAAYDVAIVPSVCNYDFAWTTAEYDAFESFVLAGGGLYVWTDNPITSHVATDPLITRFGLSRTGAWSFDDVWPLVLPPNLNLKFQATGGGTLQGGLIWVQDSSGATTGVVTDAGLGRVLVLGDIGTYSLAYGVADAPQLMRLAIRALL